MSLLTALRQRWISAVILSGLLGTIAAVGMWVLLTPKHVAFAKIQVLFDKPSFLKTAGPNDFKTLLQTTAGRITGRPVIWAALKRDEVRRLGLLDGQDPDTVVQAIEEDLKAEFKDHLEILTIQYSHHDPNVATVIANAIKEAYMEEYVYADGKRRAARVTELERAVSDKSGEISTKRESLRKRSDELGGDPSIWQTQRLEAIQALKDTRQQYTTVQFKLFEARAQLETFEARLKGQRRAMEDGKDSLEIPVPRPYIPRMLTIPKPYIPPIDETELELAIDKALDADDRAKKLRETLTNLEVEVDEYIRKGFRKNYLSREIAEERAEVVRKQLDKARSSVETSARKLIAKRHAALVEAANRAHEQKVEEAKALHEEKVAAIKQGYEEQKRLAKYNQDQRLVQISSGAMARILSPEEAEVYRDQFKRQIEQLTGLDEKLKKDIDEYSKQAARAPQQAIDYEQLVSEIKNDEVLLANLRHNLERERLEVRAAPRVSKLQDAELMKKDNKKQLLASLVSPIAVIGAVCGCLALLEHRKRKVYSSSAISRGLGIRVVGAVPRMPNLERQPRRPDRRERTGGHTSHGVHRRHPHPVAARGRRPQHARRHGHQRHRRRGQDDPGGRPRLQPGPAGRRTLLLDGDLRRPTVHELFEVPMQPGFSEVLLGEIEVAEVAVESMQENLSVMPAGQWDREVLLALSRDGLEGIFEKLAEEFDFIVVDSHPVLSATDALLLGRRRTPWFCRCCER